MHNSQMGRKENLYDVLLLNWGYWDHIENHKKKFEVYLSKVTQFIIKD